MNTGGAILLRNPGSIATDKNFDRTVCYPLDLAEKTDMKVRCLEVTNANARISAQFALVLVKQ